MDVALHRPPKRYSRFYLRVTDYRLPSCTRATSRGIDRSSLGTRMTSMAKFARRSRLLRSLACACLLGATLSHCSGAEDQVLLISTRQLGTRCDPEQMLDGLECRERVADDNATKWRTIRFEEIAQNDRPTLFYIHGNRVGRGRDKTEGLAVYQRLAQHHAGEGPIRYVIWSWPSDQIRRPVLDYKVKAARTRPVGWQLAWAIDQLPAETPLALVGYSYGARIATGALHLLAGGALGELKLGDPRPRPPVHAALIAAAEDAAWIRPGGFHGRALSQIDRLVLLTNRLDPAMRFYHLGFGRDVQPLGYTGLVAGRPQGKVWSVDLTEQLGRTHALGSYLRAKEVVARVWPTP